MNYSQLHLVAVVSNPMNYKSRYENYKIFEESILRKGAHYWCVELCTGARTPKITSVDNYHHIQLFQTGVESNLWLKEQMINIAFMTIVRDYPDARYLGYSDADLLFEYDFLEKTIQALQLWPIVQNWSHITCLDAKGHATSMYKSYMYLHHNPWDTKSSSPGYPPRIGSPGGSFFFRREMLNQLGSAISGPLIDFGIVGSGDLYFIQACMGQIERSCNKKFHPNYNKWLRQYADHTDWIVQRNVGYTPNHARHLWHGNTRERFYGTRHQILIDFQFDPETDLTKDVMGLWRLVVKSPRQIGLRDAIDKYMASRNEDSIV